MRYSTAFSIAKNHSYAFQTYMLAPKFVLFAKLIPDAVSSQFGI